MTTTQNGTTSQLKISVNLTDFTIGDLRALDGASRTSKELVVLLDRVVEGGARHLPLRSLRPIGEALKNQMEAMAQDDGEGTAIDLPEGMTVDVDQLTIGDLELLDTEGRSADDLITLLDRVVVGQSIEEVPVKYLASISAAMRQGMEAMNDLGN